MSYLGYCHTFFRFYGVLAFVSWCLNVCFGCLGWGGDDSDGDLLSWLEQLHDKLLRQTTHGRVVLVAPARTTVEETVEEGRMEEIIVWVGCCWMLDVLWSCV